MRVIVVTPPAPVVSYAEAAARLKLGSGAGQQADVEKMIAAATALFDPPLGWLGRAIGEQTLELRCPAFYGKRGKALKLPYPPIATIVSVKYLDANGAEQSLAPSDYELIGEDLWPGLNTAFPATRSHPEAVFGAQADKMAQFAIAGLDQFQQVGEGYFETLLRVASTVETVTSSLQLLGLSAQSLGIDASMAITSFFDSASGYQQAAGRYFELFYSEAEQTAAKTAQLGKVFASIGVTMPDSIAAFRALVDAQDLATEAGQQMYATLLQIAPAFAEITTAGRQASNAAAILRERNDLQRQMLELDGNTAAIRELDLQGVDASNQALLQQIWARQDAIAAEQAAQKVAEEARRAAEQAASDQLRAAQEAARAAEQLADAWRSIGDGIVEEIKRIRGLTQSPGQSYAQMVQAFDAANLAARGGNQDAAKELPGLSKAMLDAAAEMATSSVELMRIQNQTAAALSTTYAVIGGGAVSSPLVPPPAQSWWQSFTDTQVGTAGKSVNDDLVQEVRGLKAELTETRANLGQKLERVIVGTDKSGNALERSSRLAGDGTLAVSEAA